MFTPAVNMPVQRNSRFKGRQGSNSTGAIEWPNSPRIRITLRTNDSSNHISYHGRRVRPSGWDAAGRPDKIDQKCSNHKVAPKFSKFKAGGKPLTLLPTGGIVELFAKNGNGRGANLCARGKPSTKVSARWARRDGEIRYS